MRSVGIIYVWFQVPLLLQSYYKVLQRSPHAGFLVILHIYGVINKIRCCLELKYGMLLSLN